jgi:hypothetical protein
LATNREFSFQCTPPVRGFLAQLQAAIPAQYSLESGNSRFILPIRNHTFNQQFYGNDNGIFKSNTGFRNDIIANVYTAVSLRYDYETEPADGKKSYDTTLAVGRAEF